MAIQGPWRQPIHEGWLSLAGWAALTSRARLGLMVGANTFRNPGLTAKLATTLDHISGGRAVLGIGGAWFEREHAALGIDFGSGFGERLDRLDESVGIMRRLLDGETVDHDGPLYACARRPFGRDRSRRTCRSSSGDPDRARRSGRSLATATAGTRRGRSTRSPRGSRSCGPTAADVGRDPATIERTVSFPILIRDRRADAETAFDGLLTHNRIEGGAAGMNVPVLLGAPAEIAAAIAPYRDLGFGTVHRPAAGPVRRRDDRPDRRGPRRAGRDPPTGRQRRPRRVTHRRAERGSRVTVVVLAGGVGGAKLAHGVQAVVGAELAVVVNTGDDLERHGLEVWPDHDTVMYTLAGLDDRVQGWGVRGRDLRGRRPARGVRRGDLVPARRPRPRHAHRPERPAAARVAADGGRARPPALARDRRPDPADDRRARPDGGPDR